MKPSNDNLAYVKKQYKNTELLFSLYLDNYHGNYIYIRIDYYKKLKCYRLSWIDLAHVNNNFNSVVAYEYIPNLIADEIKKRMLHEKPIQDDIEDKDECLVTVTIKNEESSFYRYISKENIWLFHTLCLIFDFLPRQLNCFLEEMSGKILGNYKKYEIEEPFKFDLFNDNLKKIFELSICQKGEECYKQGLVFFLEKIGDSYLAVVGGKNLYFVMITYNDITKDMQVYSSCPEEYMCQHVYATIMAIRHKKFRKFYKITHDNKNKELLDKIFSFNFLLSIGIDDQNVHFLVIENREIRLLPIRNQDGICEWRVLEDDEKNTLSKRLNEIL